MDDFTQKTVQFKDWLISNGVKINPKIEITDLRSQQQGRGVVALQNIAENEELFSIPLKCVLASTDTNKNSNFNQLAEKYELNDWSALIVRIMCSYKTSFWKPYFDLLPEKFNTPMFWDPEETEKLLKGSAVVSKIGREEADELFEQLRTGIFSSPELEHVPKEDLTNANFHRFGSLIMSYAFDLPAEVFVSESKSKSKDTDEEDEDDDGFEEDLEGSEENIKAMVPLADLLNSHSRLHNARLCIPDDLDSNSPFNENAELQMIATKDIAQGEQVYNTYGAHPSGDLLRRYGYVESSEPSEPSGTSETKFEILEISLEMILNEAAAALKLPLTEIEKRVSNLEKYFDEVPPNFDITMQKEEEQTEAEIEFEPEMLILLYALLHPSLDKKQFKLVCKQADRSQLDPSICKILEPVLESRRKEYGEIESNSESNSHLQVFTTKEDMCTQVRRSEVEVITRTLEVINKSVHNKKPKLN